MTEQPSNPQPPQPQQPSLQAARSGTLAITNLTKLVGLAIGFNEGLLRSHHDAVTIAFAAFLCTGAQVSERVLLALIDRALGRPAP